MNPQSSNLSGRAANLLVIEIGNSHVAVGRVISADVKSLERFFPDQSEEFGTALEAEWESLPEDRERVVVVGSVVPTVLERVCRQTEEILGATARVVGRDVRLPLSLAVEEPQRVGVDRVCSAAAAYEQVGRACVVASYGTATTIDCVNDEGVFLGGAILPGFGLQSASLHEGTAALPLVEVHAATSTYGTTTEEAINNGLLYGAAGALREIVERYATDLKHWPELILTGGYSRLVADTVEFVDAVVPDLCIRGIALAYRGAAERTDQR